MRNTLLQAQCSHVNLITPFFGVEAFRSDLGWVFFSSNYQRPFNLTLQDSGVRNALLNVAKLRNGIKVNAPCPSPL